MFGSSRSGGVRGGQDQFNWETQRELFGTTKLIEASKTPEEAHGPDKEDKRSDRKKKSKKEKKRKKEKSKHRSDSSDSDSESCSKRRREKIPGTTVVLIHQGAVRVEPESVTAIQEGGQRQTTGP